MSKTYWKDSSGNMNMLTKLEKSRPVFSQEMIAYLDGLVANNDLIKDIDEKGNIFYYAVLETRFEMLQRRFYNLDKDLNVIKYNLYDFDVDYTYLIADDTVDIFITGNYSNSVTITNRRNNPYIPYSALYTTSYVRWRINSFGGIAGFYISYNESDFTTDYFVQLNQRLYIHIYPSGVKI